MVSPTAATSTGSRCAAPQRQHHHRQQRATSAIPTWLRLERVGSTFRSYHSSNGTSWTLIATSHRQHDRHRARRHRRDQPRVGTLAQGVFTNVAFITPAAPPPGAPSGLTATPGDGQVTLGWTAVSGATSYTVKRATVAGGPTRSSRPG